VKLSTKSKAAGSTSSAVSQEIEVTDRRDAPVQRWRAVAPPSWIDSTARMATEREASARQSTSELAKAILKQVDFADRSDEAGARNALREIARLCRQALGEKGQPN
jgi:hypothetical protein